MGFSRLLVGLVALALAAGAACCAVGALLPIETIRPWGELVRKTSDVTPERIDRLHQACTFLAVACGIASLLLFARLKVAAAWLDLFWAELAAIRHRFRHDVDNWGRVVWIIIGVGVVLRAIRLTAPMAYDEAYTFVNLASRPWYEGIADYNCPNNHLLNTFLMHWCWRLFGPAEWALRLPAFFAGIAALFATWIWAMHWQGRRVGVIALAIAATSPFLVTYSADARGYMFVVTAAILLDDALSQWHHPESQRTLVWVTATLSAIIGLWAMPIMLYPLLGCALWFVFLRLCWRWSPQSRGKLEEDQALWPTIAGVLAAAIAVGAFYTPAYVFRGTMGLQDPSAGAVAFKAGLATQLATLKEAMYWLTGQPPETEVWMIAVFVGAMVRILDQSFWIRWVSPFVVFFGINLALRVAPPARVWIVLLPQLTILAAIGLTRGVEQVVPPMDRKKKSIAANAIALVLCAAGAWYLIDRPTVLSAERDSYISLRDAMLEIKSVAAKSKGEKIRLLAPLPCDLPAIFYRDREKIEVEINGEPQPGERLWLLTRIGLKETPEMVLKSPLINQPELIGELSPWLEQKEKEFKHLSLYRASALVRSKSPAPQNPR